MDKTFAFVLIAFFAICASFITWTAFSGPKRNAACTRIAYGYSVFVWLLVASLTVLTIIY